MVLRSPVRVMDAFLTMSKTWKSDCPERLLLFHVYQKDPNLEMCVCQRTKFWSSGNLHEAGHAPPDFRRQLNFLDFFSEVSFYFFDFNLF